MNYIKIVIDRGSIVSWDKRADDSQIVRAKGNLKLSYGGSSQRQSSGTNQLIKALRQGGHWFWGLTHRRAM